MPHNEIQKKGGRLVSFIIEQINLMNCDTTAPLIVSC